MTEVTGPLRVVLVARTLWSACFHRDCGLRGRQRCRPPGHGGRTRRLASALDL